MTDKWFATSRYSPSRTDSKTWARKSELFMIHAKELGTTTSACGADTSSWFKHWESFHAVRTDQSCPKCLAVIAAEVTRKRAGTPRPGR